MRAKSFHIQILSRAIILEVLNRLNLSPIVKIMDAGGKFIFILPNTPETKTVLEQVKLEIQNYFFDAFSGELQRNTTSMVVNQIDMKQEKFIHVLEDLNDDLENTKLSGYNDFFKQHSPIKELDWSKYQHGECGYCKRNPAGAENDDGERPCYFCQQLIKIGKALPSSEYAYFTKYKPSYQHKNYIELFNGIYLVLDTGLVKSDVENALDLINMKTRGVGTFQAIAGIFHLKMVFQRLLKT